MTTVIEANTANKPAQRTLLADLPNGELLVGEHDGTVTRAKLVMTSPCNGSLIGNREYARMPKATVVNVLPHAGGGDTYTVTHFNVGTATVKALCLTDVGKWFIAWPAVEVPCGAFGGGQ
jgi:hypothetical protein